MMAWPFSIRKGAKVKPAGSQRKATLIPGAINIPPDNFSTTFWVSSSPFDLLPASNLNGFGYKSAGNNTIPPDAHQPIGGIFGYMMHVHSGEVVGEYEAGIEQ